MNSHALALTLTVCFCGVLRSAAGTVAHWQFDDGVPTNTAATLVTETNAPTLNATATINGTGSIPRFNADVPGSRIWSAFGGTLINATNSSSLRLVNAGLPVDTNSNNGGCARVTDNDPLLRPTNLTVEVFVKIDRLVNYPLIIGKSRADGGGTSWNFDMDNACKPRVRIDSSPLGGPTTNGTPGWNQSWSSSVSVNDGQWHHLAFTYAQTNKSIKIYVDYVLRGTGNAFSNLVYDSREMRIGQGAGGRAFDGWFDEIRITDDVLLPEQFMTVSEPSSTRGYWTFDDGAAGTTAGTLTNTFYAPLMHGTAGTTGGAKPTFSAERPPATTARISDGKSGPVVNLNSGSLLFVNAGLPASSNSLAGGVVTLPGSTFASQMTNFTAEAFVKVNRHVLYPQIIGKSRASGLSWSLALNPSGNLRARFDTQNLPDITTGNNQSFDSSAFLEDGKWHHVALTYDYPTKTVRMYKDYVMVLEGATTNPLYTDSGNFQIGAGDMAFDGWIDEVRLTDRVLAPGAFLYTVPVMGTLLSID